MGTTYAIRELFCRQLFDDARSTAELRRAYLKTLREDVVRAFSSGSAVVSTSANGASVGFQFFAGWNPSDAAELISEAYTWANAADEATALALLPSGPVTSYGHDFTLANASGGAM